MLAESSGVTPRESPEEVPHKVQLRHIYTEWPWCLPASVAAFSIAQTYFLFLFLSSSEYGEISKVIPNMAGSSLSSESYGCAVGLLRATDARFGGPNRRQTPSYLEIRFLSDEGDVPSVPFRRPLPRVTSSIRAGRDHLCRNMLQALSRGHEASPQSAG